MLPEAQLVFLDELLNANSAILNSLLMVLNERVFRRGREKRNLPTLMVVGASNRLPEDDALGALFDRFLLRVTCENVPSDRLGDVLHAGWKLDVGRRGGAAGISIDDVRKLHGALGAVELEDVRPAVAELVVRLRNAGLPVSDRRAVKLQRLVAASALLSGRRHALASDLWVFRYIWDTVEQQEVLASIVGDAVAASPADPADHPRSRGVDAPDPEALARDLEDVGRRLGDVGTTPADRSVLRDRLGVLAGRCEWVKDERQRAALLGRVEALWPRAGGRA